MTDLPPADTYVDEPPLTDDDLIRLYNTIDDYDELVAEDGAAAVDPGPAAAWAVDGANTAAWAMTKLAAAHAEIADAAERRDAYIARIVDAYTAETKRATRDAEFFTGHLVAYAIAVRAETGDRTKTVITPAGVVKTTAHADRVVVIDPDTVLAWAATYAPDAIKRTLLTTPITKAVAITVVPTSVVMTCGCVVGVDPGDANPARWATDWAVGTAILCPSCDNDALVGRWHSSTTVPTDTDGNHVPGVDIEPAHVTAKVVPA